MDLRGVAQRVGAKKTVLSHMVPLNNPDSRWLQGQAGYDGELIVGKDLMSFGVGKRAAH